MWEGFGKIFQNIAGAILGSLASAFISQGLNAAMGPKQPSRQDVMRDLQMQGDALRGASQPVRTHEQEQADQMAVEQSQARQATFRGLSEEYNKLQAAGPTTMWDPYEEANIRKEAMADAAVRGMAESGQAQELVSRRLDEARLKRSQGASQQHEQKLSNLRQQMVPYSQVERPGQAQMSPVPSVAPMPRTATQPFSTAPLDIVSMLRPGQQEPVKKRPEDSALSLYGGIQE